MNLNNVIQELIRERDHRIATADIRKDLNTIVHILDSNQTLRDNLAVDPEYKMVIESLRIYIEKAYKADLKDIRYNQ